MSVPGSDLLRRKNPEIGVISVFLMCGPCRDRTDDIHGVSVALYQLS